MDNQFLIAKSMYSMKENIILIDLKIVTLTIFSVKLRYFIISLLQFDVKSQLLKNDFL